MCEKIFFPLGGSADDNCGLASIAKENIRLKVFNFLHYNPERIILTMKILYQLWSDKRTVFELAANDFITKYAGSYLGIFWAITQPIITILVYWCVFEFGLKSGSPMADVPYILWFALGMVPWFFFSESIINTTNCLFEYSYLVKKVVFHINILPIVKIISALFIHCIFIVILIFLLLVYGIGFSINWLWGIYYLLCMIALVSGISFSTSAIVLFVKDLTQLINIIMQIGMWVTPIIWSYTIVPDKYLWIVKINPVFYITEGYRNAFLGHGSFFDDILWTCYFWILTLTLLFIGITVFKKLRPHFADVL